MFISFNIIYTAIIRPDCIGNIRIWRKHHKFSASAVRLVTLCITVRLRDEDVDPTPGIGVSQFRNDKFRVLYVKSL